MRRFVMAAVVALIAGGAACSWLLPEGMTIRGPIMNSLLGRGIEAPAPEVVESRIRAPEGFSVWLWAEDVPNARFMRFSPGGALLVSQPRRGRIVQFLGDADGDGFSDGQRVFLDGLDRPHGIDFRGGHVYVGEASAITRVAFDETPPRPIEARGEPVRIVEGIPAGKNHWTRTPRFGPDGALYLTVGSSCNVCVEEDARRATMLRYEADGSGETIYASGLRNSAGFDWRPETGELFATDNGRDLLGDDYPPCELNRIVRNGFYGWPYANGFGDPDPDFGPGQDERIAASIDPVHGFRAHNAPLGIHFVRHGPLPEAYRGAALVALHGSWNRSELDGYKVVSLHWDEQDRIEERDFLTGFQQGDDVIGRPVDVQQGPDGAFYVSDDYAGAIYRVAWTGSGSTGALSRSPRPGPDPAPRDPLAGIDPPQRAALIARGGALFDEQACGTCHRQDQAAPGAVVKRLEGLAARYDVPGLRDYFLAPQSPMPVFALPEDQRLALSVYLLSEHAD